MIIPVQLKPIDEWPGDCKLCRTDGYESYSTHRQMQKRYSGRWVEIDIAQPDDCHPLNPNDPFPRGSAWCMSLQSTRKLFTGVSVSSINQWDRPRICSHMIEKYTLVTGRIWACLHGLGLLRNFPKERSLAKDADPLVGKAFYSAVECQCGQVTVQCAGEVMERIPGADAYVVRFCELTPALDMYLSVQRVSGHEMTHWLFFDSLTEVKSMVSRTTRNPHQHPTHARPN